MKSSLQDSTLSELLPASLRIASQKAVTEERRRLAREIHDTLAQAFTGILFQADILEFSSGANDAQIKSALERIQELARSGLDEARRAVQALRPQALEGSTLPVALEKAAKSVSQGPHYECEFRQVGRAWKLEPRAEDELFRIAQEAMNNAWQHGRAKRAIVQLAYQSGQVILTVRDHGVGLAATAFPARRQGHGWAIMRERAERIGGRLEIESPATGGVAIRVVVPALGSRIQPRMPAKRRLAGLHRVMSPSI